MISLLLAKKILELFIIILMGFLIVRFNLLTSKESKGISKVIIYLINPCVIIGSFQVDYSDEVRNGLLLATFAALIIHILLIFITKTINKKHPLNPIENASLIYSNSGNLTIPLVSSLFGPQWVIFSIAFMSVQLFFIWTHCKQIISEDKSFELKKILTNINLISIIIGLLMFIFKIHLPNVFKSSVSSVASMIGPLSMIVTGMIIGNIDLKKITIYKNIYFITFIKMLVLPFIMLFFLKYSKLSLVVPNGEIILLITLLGTITPSASTVTQMAQIYEKDSEYASIINVVTTLVCILTMPIMVYLYKL